MANIFLLAKQFMPVVYKHIIFTDAAETSTSKQDKILVLKILGEKKHIKSMRGILVTSKIAKIPEQAKAN